MRRKASLLLALGFVGLLWIVSGAPTNAEQAPSSLPNPSPSITPTAGIPVQPSEAPNPFPSASPSVTRAGGNGYAALGYVGASASGGQIAQLPGRTGTPSAFPASGASGFWVDLLGRVSPSYLAALLFDDYSVHGGDRPLVSYGQGRVLYQLRASRAALGVGLISVQRSTSSANVNAFGLGISLLPEFKPGTTVYGSAFFYPHLQTAGVSASLTSLDAGLMYFPPHRGGLFFRVGGSLRTGAPSITSPRSVNGLMLGIGSSF